MANEGKKAAFPSEEKPNLPLMWRELKVEQFNSMLSALNKTPIDEEEQEDKEVLTKEDTGSKSMPKFTKASHYKSFFSKNVSLRENVSTIF